MRLEPVCDLKLAYRREPLYAGLLKLVAPYGTPEGSLYGEGEVDFRGARLNGTAPPGPRGWSWPPPTRPRCPRGAPGTW